MKSTDRPLVKLLYTKFTYLFTLFVFISSVNYAQINNSDFRVRLNPEILEACGGNSNEVVLIKAKKETLHGFDISFTLPRVSHLYLVALS